MRRKVKTEQRIWCVYKHTNLINNKVYIGKTCKKPEYRWNEGKGYQYQPHFWHSIQKYGWNNFSHEIIMSCLTNSEASELEKRLIKEYNSINPDCGYNQTTGGEGMSGWHHTEKSLAKIRLSNSRRGVSEKTKNKMRSAVREKIENGWVSPFKGKKHSTQTKELFRKMAIQRWKDDGQRRKMLLALRSDERNKKISEKRKELWNDPEYRNHMKTLMNSDVYKNKISAKNKGRKHSLEELKKMSEANSGKNNGMYGKHGKDNPRSKPVIQYDLEGNTIKEYANAMEAFQETGISNASICSCCRKKLRTAGGFVWRYADKEKKIL